jgi:hypothetical protein
MHLPNLRSENHLHHMDLLVVTTIWHHQDHLMVRQNRYMALLHQVHTDHPDHQNQFMGHQVSSSPLHFHLDRILSIPRKDRN